MNELLTVEKIQEVLKLGEDSYFQFKQDVNNANQLAEEMVAFSNAKGGYILVGIADKKNEIVGLQLSDIHRINSLVSNAASENISLPIHPLTENKIVDGKIIIVIQVQEGTQKPYQTKAGKFLTKSGADKRILSNEELSRIFQENNNFHTEELAIANTSIENDLDKGLFYSYFEKREKQSVIAFLEENQMSLQRLLENKNLAVGDNLTLIGLLFFSKNPQQYRSLFCIDAVSFYGNDIADDNYISKEKITGTLDIQYRRGLDFVKNQLNKINGGEGFNNNGILEINEKALEEAITNALIHRNYAFNSTIKIYVFKDRVEIISPGKLPNSLTEEKIKYSNSIARNPLIAKLGYEILPYSGLGSGVPRIFKYEPNTILKNNIEGEQFTVTLFRK